MPRNHPKASDRRHRDHPVASRCEGQPAHYIARIQAEQAIVDGLPASLRELVWESGFAALGLDQIEVRRTMADQARARRKDRQGAYQAPKISGWS